MIPHKDSPKRYVASRYFTAKVTSPALIGDEGRPKRNDNTVCRGVQRLNESNEQSVDSGDQAEVAAHLAGRITEVSRGEQEERNPEKQEDAPDSLAHAERNDPQQQREHAEEQQHRSTGDRRRSLQPARSDAPLQQSEPPPEQPVGSERNGAERVAIAELQHA